MGYTCGAAIELKVYCKHVGEKETKPLTASELAQYKQKPFSPDTRLCCLSAVPKLLRALFIAAEQCSIGLYVVRES